VNLKNSDCTKIKAIKSESPPANDNNAGREVAVGVVIFISSPSLFWAYAYPSPVSARRLINEGCHVYFRAFISMLVYKTLLIAVN
jgi:hypothetical protein